MGARLKVDGKLFEFVAGAEKGAFPFNVSDSEVNRKRSSVIRLGVEEFTWLAREMVRSCSEGSR